MQKRARRPLRKKSDASLRVRALQLLARREYSRAELRGKLLLHVHAEGDVDPSSGQPRPFDLDRLLDDFAARGWLSDARAAMQLVHAKRSRFGTQRITHELRQKGIAEKLIEDAQRQLKETELEAARQVWQKKFGAVARDEKERARQVRFLQSRGFALDVIFNLLALDD